MEAKFKPIFIVSNWKSGSTPFQFLLERDPKIYNFFPDDESNYDGTAFWKRHGAHVLNRTYGNKLPEKYYKRLNRDAIISELNDKFDDNCEYGLFKRPQFILNIDFIKWLFPNVKILGIVREPIPNAYSYFRSNYANNPNGNGMHIGLKPYGWRKFNNKPLLEYTAWCYQIALKNMKKNDIPYIMYSDLCNKTDETIDYLSDILDVKLNIEYDDIPDLNYVYKTGCQLMSRNLDTEKGKLNIGKTDKTDVPPFTQEQIDEFMKYLKKYEDMEI
jgi:hypothetical protein